MTLEEFRKTGTFYPREEFQKNNKTMILHDECTDVIVYEGNYIIEVLKGDTFYYSMYENEYTLVTDVRNNCLEMVERIMWQRHAEQFINNKTKIKQE